MYLTLLTSSMNSDKHNLNPLSTPKLTNDAEIDQFTDIDYLGVIRCSRYQNKF